MNEITKGLVISFFFSACFIFIVMLLFEDKINTAFALVDVISIKQTEVEDKITLWDEKTKTIENYPSYGKRFAKVKIPSVDINNSLYHGDTMDILRYGIGHYSGSYFPGEGGTILVAGHNTRGFLRTLPNVKVGAEIVVETDYGTFTYQVYDTKVLKASELDKVSINKDEEIFIIYTCYPVTVGHPSTRFVVYARRIL